MARGQFHFKPEVNMKMSCLNIESYTLFVGEGDFSYSASYILKSIGSKERVIACCLNSGPLSERQQNNTKIIEKNGGLVYTDVDATCLESHPKVNKYRYKKIVFNFPHVPGKMNIRKNRQLVLQFLISAAKILEDTGAIYVTLCQGQGGTEIEKVKRKWCDTWQIVRLAASASLVLYEVKPFDAKEFQTYRCTGFRGLQKSFNTNGALTHIFKQGKPVEINVENLKCNTDIVDIYFQECVTLNKFINNSLCHPSFKFLSILNSLSKKIFQHYDKVTVNDLLTCGKPSTLNSDSVYSIDSEYCEKCISNLNSIFLQKKSSDQVISISCNLCCLKTINLSEPPVHHILSYISTDSEALLTDLPMFLSLLNQVFTLNSEREISTSAKESSIHNKSIIPSLIHDNQETISKKFPVKKIANLYAKYFIHKGDEQFFYSDVDVYLSTDKILNNVVDKKGNQTVKIGTILQYNNLEKLTCILLNLDTLACLKYHVMDYRIQLSYQSFYSFYEVFGSTEEVYRPFSLYPPTYVHDTSFYIEEDFNENVFFMLVKNTVGLLIKSVILIDSYYDKDMQKHSKCYQFVYQSSDLSLTKEKANEIHTLLMRKTLQNSLNICLR